MISIIVPIFNAAEYLEACIGSLARQTESNLQIILVEDGSDDNSRHIAEGFAKQDERIVVLPQPHAGQSAARNTGLRHAKGEYIAFVDADDQLEPDWCERHLKAIDGVEYVQSGYKRIDNGQWTMDNGQITNDQRPTTKGQLPRHKYQFTSPCMRLYRREAIAGMQFEEGMIYEDVVWSADLWMRNLRCRRIPYTGYLYTLNPRSTTSRRHPEAEKRVMLALKKRIPAASLCSRLILLFTIIRLKLHFIKQ